MIKRELELHRLNSHTESRVIMAAGRFVNHVFRYGGHIGTYMIIAGFDVKGPQIVEISGDGLLNTFPYLALGSGSLAATSIIESGFKDDMTEEEAIALCVKSIEAGIVHDLGSGSNVDICVMKKGKTTYTRGYKSDNHKMFVKPDGYTFKKERVQVLEEYKHKLIVEDGGVPMEL
jgi:20S proteasome subunit beta 2